MPKKTTGEGQQVLLDPLQSQFDNSKKVTLVTWPVKDIVEAPWNPNEMAEPEYGALKEDMTQGGPASINPLTCSHYDRFDPAAGRDTLVALDGNHRLRIAKELGWPTMRVVLDDTVPDEGWARTLTLTRNRERGSLNEFKEAENFKWFIDHEKMTQEEIAKRFHVDKTTVSKRLSLLRLEPEVKSVLTTDVPETSVSVLEPIAALKPEAQKLAAAEVVRQYKNHGRAPTVDDATDIAKRAKEYVKEQEEFKNLLNAPNTITRTCPKCGAEPEKLSYNGAPYVRDEPYHEWDVTKDYAKEKKGLQQEDDDTQKKERVVPDYIRTTHELGVFENAFTEYAKQFVSKLSSITRISVHGTVDGKKSVSVDISPATEQVTFWAHDQDDENDYNDRLFFKVEGKSYNVAALKQYHTVVHANHKLQGKKKLEEFEKEVEAFLKDFAKASKKK